MSAVLSRRGILAEMQARQPLLALAGWAMLAVLVASLALLPFDPRQINGVSVWVKPGKFAASLLVWFWTLAWAWGVLAPAARESRAARIVLWGTLATGLFEQGWITLRAASGVPSHFATDPLGMALYPLMGVAAIALSLLAAWLGVMVLRQGDPAASRNWRLAVGLGLAIGGVLAAFTGASISAMQGPRIGGLATDAQGFAPFFWSRTGGDLRIAHFLGVHAMQVLPALALLGAGAGLLGLAAAAWTGLALGAWAMALAGLPLSF